MRKWEAFSEEELREIYNQSTNKQTFAKLLGYKGTDTRFIKEIQSVYPWLTFLRYEDLTGRVFGKLTVLSKNNEFEDCNHSYWNCQCECGKITTVRRDALIDGKTKSCGCNSYRMAGVKNMDNLTGQKFGKLTVIKRDFEKTDASKQAFWWCACDCGEKISVGRCSLKSGATRSCGCLKSKGELKIKQLLVKENIAFKTQFYFENLIGEKSYLKFDFAIFENNNNLKCLIEYQGKQHYEPIEHFGGEEQFIKQQFYDNKKRSFCKQNNIGLIEIPYWDFDKIDSEYLLNLIK